MKSLPSRLLLAAMLLCLASACGRPKIWVQQTKYKPDLNFDTAEYKGLPVHLRDVDNQAEDTSRWYYYSPDESQTYEGAPYLRSYFQDCFEKAMLQMGMSVSKRGKPDLTAPAVQFIMKSITDERFVFEVKIRKGKANLFKKTYTITEPAVPREQRNAAKLEQRAYYMVNRTVRAVFGDPLFRRALLLDVDKCQIHIREILGNREQFVRTELGLTDFSCQDPSSKPISIKRAQLTLWLTPAKVCDVYQPLSMELDLPGFFATCEAQINSAKRKELGTVVGLLAPLDPEVVSILGHTDERRITSKECRAKFASNYELSLARARSVVGVVAKDSQLSKTRFSAEARSDRRLLEKGCSQLPSEEERKRCHQRNRRVEIRVERAAKYSFQISKCPR